MSNMFDISSMFKDVPTICMINNCRPTARIFMPALKSKLDFVSINAVIHEVPNGSPIQNLSDLINAYEVILIGVGD